MRKFGRDRTGKQRWNCAQCQFTIGNTCVDRLAGKRLKAVILFQQGMSVRRVASSLQIAKDTARTYRPTGSFLCACGRDSKHQGWCSWRFQQSEGRRAWHRKWCGLRIPKIPKGPRIEYSYPYIMGAPNDDHELLLLVNGAVSKNIPPEARADICQDILVALLSGTVAKDQLTLAAKDYTRRYWKDFGRKFGALSLDQPAPGSDSKTLLRDLIAG